MDSTHPPSATRTGSPERVHPAVAFLPVPAAFVLQWLFWEPLQPYAWVLFYPAALSSLWLARPSRPAPPAVQAQDPRQESLAALIESMDEGFCVLEMIYNVDGKPVDYRFVETNPAFEQQTGLINGLGKTMLELVPGHDAHWFSMYGEVARTGKGVRFENEAKAMGRHFDVYAFRIGGEGSKRVGVLFKDVTEKKRVDQSLVTAKEEAEVANHAKDSFLATMSHEIRTPLTGMLGMLELLSMTPLGKDQRATLDTAWESGRGLLRIVSDILDWSKIEEGKFQLAPEPTSIPHLLNTVTNTYSRVASAKSLVLRNECDAGLGAVHIVDAHCLSQVLNNFVSNAIKFTAKGEVVLRADLVEKVAGGERIRFSVTDTGVGIPQDVQAQLFQRYRQANANTARLYGGTGLGLAICRRLTEMLDGQLSLESEPGKGSTFSLTLLLPLSTLPAHPVANQAADVVVQRTVAPLFSGGQQDVPMVLAVDDHPINRGLLAQQIKLLGLRVQTAENGQAALAALAKGGISLVITDCHMPEMDGYALARAIRAREAAENLPHMPVIAWTANALAEETESCAAAGMDDLLVKPTRLNQLKEVLARRLSGAGHSPSNQDALGGCIDRTMLAETGHDPAAQLELLADFHRQVQSDVARLTDLLQRDDRLAVEELAHRMRGSSGMVGATAIAAACAAMEQACKAGDLALARAGKPALDEAASRLRAALAAEKTGPQTH